ncbi:MAG: peptidase [Prochlorococcus sp.]|nr:peptidase [Prochlorococcaceae cyanobacterium Fu_MAG_50]
MHADLCPPVEEIRVLEGGLQAPSLAAAAVGYGADLGTTRFGYPTLERWCIWVEPDATSPQTQARWLQRWSGSVDAAIDAWVEVIPITRVNEPERAQIHVLRRRPPRRQLASGWRASNGRSTLRLAEVKRQGHWRLEPTVEVMVSPELRAPVLQAAALHELGHAFGLWGHSDQPADAMAVSQGVTPVLALSARDLATLGWLKAQPGGFGSPLPD